MASVPSSSCSSWPCWLSSREHQHHLQHTFWCLLGSALGTHAGASSQSLLELLIGTLQEEVRCRRLFRGATILEAARGLGPGQISCEVLPLNVPCINCPRERHEEHLQCEVGETRRAGAEALLEHVCAGRNMTSRAIEAARNT